MYLLKFCICENLTLKKKTAIFYLMRQVKNWSTMLTSVCEFHTDISLSRREAEEDCKISKTFWRFLIGEQPPVCTPTFCMWLSEQWPNDSLFYYIYLLQIAFQWICNLSLIIIYGLRRDSIVIPKEIEV